MPYPDRSTVLPFPNNGTFQLNTTAGAKLFESLPLRLATTSGFGEFLPTNCTCVRSVHVLVKLLVPGLEVQEILRKALSSFPMTRASKPVCSHGLPYQSQRSPRFSVRSGRNFQSSLK